MAETLKLRRLEPSIAPYRIHVEDLHVIICGPSQSEVRACSLSTLHTPLGNASFAAEVPERRTSGPILLS